MTLRPRSARPVGINSFQPQLESLEARWMPAGIAQVGNIVYVLGTSGPDVVRVTDGGNYARGSVQVTMNSQSFVSGPGVREVWVHTYGGSDRVTYIQTAAVPIQGFRHVEFRLGAGDDVCAVTLTGGVRAGGFFDMYADGHLGNDTITVTATRGVNVAGGATLRWWLVGGDNNDVVATSYGGQVQGQLLTRIEGNPGMDNVAATFNIWSGSTGFVATHMFGGTNLDHLRMIVRRLQPGNTARIDTFVDGGQFLDWLTRTANVVTKNVEFDTVVT